MNNVKELSMSVLDDFNFEETKRNLICYFRYIEKLEWEWQKLNIQKGMTAICDFSAEYQKLPFIPIGKDAFSITAKDYKEEELKQYIASYYRAKSILTDKEELYIVEAFENGKCDDELAVILECASRDSREFRNIRRSAVYKFADILGLAVEKEREMKR